MRKAIRATYEGGAFYPLDPICLDEHQRVTLTVEEEENDMALVEHSRFASPDEWAYALELENLPSIDEVRRRLTAITGLVSETIAGERESGY